MTFQKAFRKILVGISLYFLLMNSAFAGGSSYSIPKRDGIVYISNYTLTIVYFDTGKVCEGVNTEGAQLSCFNWNETPLMQSFFYKKCLYYYNSAENCKKFKTVE